MRLAWIGLAAAILTASAALANEPDCASTVQKYATTDIGGSAIPVVPRGNMLALACDSIRSAGAQVSVVMTIADQESDAPPVLATEQKILLHSVNVQVPDFPDLANHTVHVKVYVTDATGTRFCDAGRVRIV